VAVTVMGGSPVDREAISRELETSRRQLHQLLATAEATDLRRRSAGTQWTNEQLLFHMVFGFLIVRTLLVLVRVIGRLPAPVGRGFAGLLDSAARPFHIVNFWGSVNGARVFDAQRMGWLGDRTIAALQRSLARESAESLRRGMAFPTRWDPYFTPFMSLADLYRYPSLHFEHHRRQLTLHAGG
jgi:hypothetical protein